MEPIAQEMDILEQLPRLEDGWTRLYLCRHGETPANASHIIQGQSVDAELNEVGTNQATQLAEFLKRFPIEKVYSSHLKRAWQTANTICVENGNLEHEVLNEIAEFNYGHWEGQEKKDIASEMSQVGKLWKQGDLHVRAPNGESVVDVVTRGKEGLSKVLHPSNNHKHIVAVAHGAFNKIILSEVLAKGVEHHRSLNQFNCCINVVDYCHESDQYVEHVFNYSNHVLDKPMGH